jgi:hypothetical protein
MTRLDWAKVKEVSAWVLSVALVLSGIELVNDWINGHSGAGISWSWDFERRVWLAVAVLAFVMAIVAEIKSHSKT